MRFVMLRSILAGSPGQTERGESRAANASVSEPTSPYARWRHGPPADPDLYRITASGSGGSAHGASGR